MQTVGRAVKPHHDVVLLNRGAYGSVYHRPRLIGIYEIYRSAFKDVAVALEDEIATREVYSAQNHGVCGCAANFDVRTAVEAECTAGQADAVGRCDGEIQLNVVGEALRWSRYRIARELSNEVHQVEVGSEGKLVYPHLSVEPRRIQIASQRQVHSQTSTHAIGIEQTNASSRQRQIEIQGRTIDHSAACVHLSPTHRALKAGDVQAVFRKR